jgi:hypothetical protein
LSHGLGRGGCLHPDAVRGAACDDHDPAIRRADPLPIACPFAALDLMHIQHGRGSAPRSLVTQPEPGAHSLSDRYRFPLGSAQLVRECDRLVGRQVGEPQPSGGGGNGRVAESLGFGVAPVGVQRQVDRPALEPYAGQQGSDLSKIICRIPCRRMEVNTSTSTRGRSPRAASSSRSRNGTPW